MVVWPPVIEIGPVGGKRDCEAEFFGFKLDTHGNNTLPAPERQPRCGPIL